MSTHSFLVQKNEINKSFSVLKDRASFFNLFAFLMASLGLPTIARAESEESPYVIRITYDSNAEGVVDPDTGASLDDPFLKGVTSNSFYEMESAYAENPRERRRAVGWLRKKIAKAREKTPNRPVEVYYFNQDTQQYDVTHVGSTEGLRAEALKAISEEIIEGTPYAQSKGISFPKYVWEKLKQHTSTSLKSSGTLVNTGLRFVFVAAGVTYANAVQASEESVFAPIRVIMSDALDWGPLLGMGGLVALASSSFIFYKKPFYGFMERSDFLVRLAQLKPTHKMRGFVEAGEKLFRWGGVAETVFVSMIIAAGILLGLDPSPAEMALKSGATVAGESVKLALQTLVLTFFATFTQGTWESIVASVYKEQAKLKGESFDGNDRAFERRLITISVVSLIVLNLNKGANPPEIAKWLYVGMGVGGFAALTAYMARNRVTRFTGKFVEQLKSSRFFAKTQSLCQFSFLKKNKNRD